MPAMQQYEQYKATLQRIADVKYASAVLQWDQETYLPKKGSDARGRQIATLTELAHQQFTAPEFGELLNSLAANHELDEASRRNVELSLEDYNRNIKIPAEFVRRLSEATNKSFHAWIESRKENSFKIFREPLSVLISLKREEAEYLGYKGHPYDALMNDFDKGLTVEQVDKLFDSLRPQLGSLLERVNENPQVANDFLFQHFDKDLQWKFGMDILKIMQFDFEAGRQDISEHPFTTNFCSQDVRVTTRIDEKDFGNMTWSCIHEGGHALYEQGLPAGQYGLPLGEYCSLSIHESQSRMWENCVGRSLSFWNDHFDLLLAYFPTQFQNISPRQFYKGINKVHPSLIRTEADELTYHFHVMIRYEIEKQLIEGNLLVEDIPTAWNEAYRKYLGIKVPDDKQGCLQDVHWSHGSFGYFATYSIGSLYAAQFYAAMQEQVPQFHLGSPARKNQLLLDWLRDNIFKHGRRYTSAELCRRATGEELNSRFFTDYVTKKYSDIYEFNS